MGRTEYVIHGTQCKIKMRYLWLNNYYELQDDSSRASFQEQGLV